MFGRWQAPSWTTTFTSRGSRSCSSSSPVRARRDGPGAAAAEGSFCSILKLGWWLVFQEVPVDERAGNSDQTLENGLEVARRAVERVGEGLVVVQAGRPTV